MSDSPENNSKNKSKNKSTVDKIVMGAIIGTAIGSALGITLAPQKGEETRQDLGHLAKETGAGFFRLGKVLLKRILGRKNK